MRFKAELIRDFMKKKRWDKFYFCYKILIYPRIFDVIMDEENSSEERIDLIVRYAKRIAYGVGVEVWELFE